MSKRRLRLVKTAVWFALWVIGAGLILNSRGFWRLFFPLHYQPTLERYGSEYGVDPLLLAAVIRAESKYHPKARSQAGALGLMQIVPETGAWVAEQIGLKNFGPDELLAPETNIRIGAWYLGHLLDQFHGDLVLALAAYNSGRGNVLGWIGEQKARGRVLTIEDIPFPETKVYVQKVLRNYYWYRKIYAPAEKRGIFWSWVEKEKRGQMLPRE
jgi:soluble lytic murein transglycosylase